MKRINNYISVCVLMLLLCCNVCSTYAQSTDEFCGDWVGTFTMAVPDPYSDGMKDERVKMYIRINKMDSEYIVRIKTQNPVSDMNYWPTCENVSRQGNSLYFTMDLGDDNDWSGNARKNGQRITSSHYTRHSSVSIDKGTLYYTDYMSIIYYGHYGKIGDGRAPVNGGYLKEVTLYRDDGW